MKFLSVSKIHFLSLLKIKTLETIKRFLTSFGKTVLSTRPSCVVFPTVAEAKGGICL